MVLPENIKPLRILQCDDLVTNIDQPKQGEQFAYEIKGFNNIIPGVVADRDRGSKNPYANNAYPTVPETGVLVGGPPKRFYDRTTDTEYDIVVSYNASSGFSRVFINDSVYAGANVGTVNNWIEPTRVISALVNGTVGAGSTSANINTVKDSLGTAYSLGTNELQWWICFNINRGKACLVASSTATAITSDAVYLGSDVGALAFTNGDQLVFFKHSWMFGEMYASLANPLTTAMMNLNLGATPHNKWQGVETQQKVNLLIGDSGTPPTMRFPMSLIRRTTAKGFFYTSGGSALTTPQANWYAERGLNLGMTCQVAGTPASPLNSAGGASTGVFTISDHAGGFLKFQLSYGDSSAFSVAYDGNCQLIRIIMTLLYDGYQESDPIFRACVDSTNFDTKSPLVYFSNFQVNLSRMNKKIQGVRLYGANLNKAKLTAGWTDSDSDYVRIRDIYFEETPNTYDGTTSGSIASATWAKLTTDEYSYVFSYTTASDGYLYGAIVTNSAAHNERTLAANLQHATQSTHVDWKPRYIAKASNQDEGIVAIDKDDKTVAVSTIDGAGVVEDDNFSMSSTDISGNSLLINLLGDGPLLGLLVQDESVYAIRQTVCEVFDMQSGVYRSFPIDAYTKYGMVVTKAGIVIAGKSSIQIIRKRGGGIEVLNPRWLNLYDGRLRTNDGTLQQITDTYRQTVVMGYSDYADEVLLHIQRNDPYTNTATWWTFIGAFPTEAQPKFRWRERIFNITGTRIYYFSRMKDNTFLLGAGSYILKYPNLTSALDLSWEDEVQSSEATNSKPITCSLGINLGSITGIDVEAILYNLMMYLKARATGSGDLFTIDFYANEETVSFQTMSIPVNGRFRPRFFKRRGPIERLRMRIQLTSTNTNTKEFTISEAVLGVVGETRPGTR